MDKIRNPLWRKLSGFIIAAELIDNLQGGIQVLAKAVGCPSAPGHDRCGHYRG